MIFSRSAAALTLALATAWVVPTTANARNDEPPLVLVLDTPGQPEFRGLRERFARELGLTLDAFIMVRVKAPQGFGERSLAEQLRVVRPLIKRYRAIAATWIDRPLPEVVLVTMMVIDSGRIMVRTIPGERRAGAETELALAARELLGTIFMFEPDPPPAVEKIVAATTQAIASPSPSLSPSPADRTIGLRADAGILAGLSSNKRYPLGLHVGTGIQFSLPNGLELQGILEVEGGRGEYPALGRVEHLGAFARIGAGYRFELDRFSLVPLLSARLGFRHTEISPHYALRHTEEQFTALLAAGLEGTIRVSPDARLVITPELAWDTTPVSLRLRSSGLVAVQTPDLYWGIRIGWIAF